MGAAGLRDHRHRRARSRDRSRRGCIAAAGSRREVWDQRQLGDQMAARMVRWRKDEGEATRRKLFSLGGARDLVAGPDREAARFDAGGSRRGDGQAGNQRQPHRGSRGDRLVDYAPHGHWNAVTFIAGLRHDRMVASFVIEGAMNGETFLAYIEQFLVPTLQPGDYRCRKQ